MHIISEALKHIMRASLLTPQREITAAHAHSIKDIQFIFIICFRFFKREFMEKRLSMLLATLFLCIGGGIGTDKG